MNIALNSKTDETRPKGPHVVETQKARRVMKCGLRKSDMKQNNLPIGVATTGVSTAVRHDGDVRYFLVSKKMRGRRNERCRRRGEERREEKEEDGR
jgi:hypothetical protein